ncbi:MAG: hypothetical protein Q9169_000452 [Polycauliona sp. 2 TL-2023]
MNPSLMRLRLTVQRHGLPPARVIWTVAAERPSYSAVGPEPTVAQLLEQVNEIIPLESDDWGLEDYAVEVGGFECLHFSETSQVLKEDDEIWPLLRRPNRPDVHIPPRKRRRLTYDEDKGDDLEADSQLVVRSGLENVFNSLSENESSGNSVNGSDDDEDLHAELNDIRHDLDPGIMEDEGTHTPSRPSDHTGEINSQQHDALSTRHSRKLHGLGLKPSSLLMDENGRPYPETYDNPLLDMFADDELVGRAALPEYVELGEAIPASRPQPKHHTGVTTRKCSTRSGRSLGKQENTVRIHEPELDTPATVRLGSSDDSGDDDFEPSDDLSMVDEESDKENAVPKSQASTTIDGPAELAAKDDSSLSSESDSDADDTSSSGSSSSDVSGLDPKDDHASYTSFGRETGDHSTSSSESSSSDSTSSSSDDGQPARPSSASTRAVDTRTQKKKFIDGHDEPTRQQRVPVPPGAGRKGTQKRNQRRRDHKKLLRLQASGELPSNATTADLHTLEAAQFEARRQTLLQAISSGGIDVKNDLALDQTSAVTGSHSPTSSHAPAVENANTVLADSEKSTSSSSEKTLVDIFSVSEPGRDTVTGPTRDPTEEPVASEGQASRAAFGNETHDRPSLLINKDPVAATQPRMRLDMDSSRRLLFGALGHRAPKTKDDEAMLQAKLRRDADTPRKPPQQSMEDKTLPDATTLASPAENVRWQDKIELSAVECCHDGIELSTPPFPFIQRWDPQQQRGYGAGQTGSSQRSKKRKRNNRNYENSFEAIEGDAVPDLEPPASNDFQAQLNEGRVTTDSITADENWKAANDQLLRETKETYGDVHERPDPPKDLPQLPEDLSGLSDLKLAAACSAGMVIAFKQLDMSAKTNWQPIMSEYRTALINHVLDDGTLSMTMALRDQPPREQPYDPDTGERIYTKFEMPGYNEDEDDNSDGLLELAFVEIIDPKLVQAPEKIPGPVDNEYQSSKALPNVNGESEGSEEQTKTDYQTSLPSSIVVHPTVKGLRDPRKDAEATEQVRQEIQDLIKDAGWRSSIQSNESAPDVEPDASWVDQDCGMEGEMDESQQDFEASHSTPFQGPSSPRFNGFSSSPPVEPYYKVEDRVKYPNLRGASPEPPDGATDDPDRTMADTSSQADMEAMQAIREDFEKELSRPAASKSLDRHPGSSRGSASPAITSQAGHEDKTSPSAETNPYNNTIPDSQPPPSNPTTTLSSPVNNHRHSSSDNDDLPDLSVVFSSFNSQRASSSANNHNHTVKAEHHSSSSDEAFMSTLPSHKLNNRKTTQFKPPSSSAPARTSSNTRAATNVSRPSALHHDKDKRLNFKPPKAKHNLLRPNKYEAAPRSSQDWIGTQVVDLTISSDPIDFAMEEENIVPHREIKDESDGDVVDEGSSLPKGEGWVSKNKAAKGKKASRGLAGGGKGWMR